MNDSMRTEHAVVIAGGGPTGLMLAAELMIAGVDVVVVERRANQDLDGSRAGGLYPRTLEVLDQRGVVDRFVAAGRQHPSLGYAYIPLDLGDFPTRHNYTLALWQQDFERILADWVLGELSAPILRERDVVGLALDDHGVDVELSDGTSLRAQYLVGCDGGRSIVRQLAGIDFPGLAASASWIIAEFEVTEQPTAGVRPEGGGIGPVDPDDLGGAYRAVVRERQAEHDTDPSLDDLRGALGAVYGTDYGLRNVRWISRFTDMSRQAAAYRERRVLLAGDAAHIHPPQGGQGLNTGVQDAVNLGWKLARVVKGTSPESLLDTYHTERHPVAARVLRNTEAQVALATPDDRHASLRDAMAELLRLDEPRRRYAGMLSALDIRYDLGDGHPLLGRRMPDLDLETDEGPTRVFAMLHDAHAVLVDLGGPGEFDLTPWADRVRLVDATYDGTWELPVVGEVEAPLAVLIRPDGHVAWTGAVSDPELPRELEAWLGAPITATG